MGVVWTPELKAKAAMTRAHNKRKKQERMEKRMAKQAEIVSEDEAGIHLGRPDAVGPLSNIGQTVHLSEVGTWPDGEPITKAPPDEIFSTVVSVPQLPEPFDWEKAPLVECQNKQADLKRDYERISLIILRRMNPPGQRWICWTQEHLDLIRGNMAPNEARVVIHQCLKSGEDGKQSFRDDGRFIVENGVRRLRPACTCNSYCYKAYQQLHRLEPRS